jgi:hypothetical protein
MQAEFLLPADAAHLLGLTPAGVKLAVKTGRLRVAAKTRRGVHLFRLEDVETFRRSRGKETNSGLRGDSESSSL